MIKKKKLINPSNHLKKVKRKKKITFKKEKEKGKTSILSCVNAPKHPHLFQEITWKPMYISSISAIFDRQIRPKLEINTVCQTM